MGWLLWPRASKEENFRKQAWIWDASCAGALKRGHCTGGQARVGQHPQWLEEHRQAEEWRPRCWPHSLRGVYKGKDKAEKKYSEQSWFSLRIQDTRIYFFSVIPKTPCIQHRWTWIHIWTVIRAGGSPWVHCLQKVPLITTDKTGIYPLSDVASSCSALSGW